MARQGHIVVALGGLGARVEVTAACAAGARVGSPIALYTVLVVREDSLTLYGFGTEEELEMFGLLTGVTGVGPRSALGVLSSLDPARIVRAVQAEDEKPFRQVSGIGPKTAKLILLSLTGKVEHLASAGAEDPAAAGASGAGPEVTLGLVQLGWPEPAAAEAVDAALGAGVPDEASPLLRAALALLQAPKGPRR